MGSGLVVASRQFRSSSGAISFCRLRFETSCQRSTRSGDISREGGLIAYGPDNADSVHAAPRLMLIVILRGVTVLRTAGSNADNI